MKIYLSGRIKGYDGYEKHFDREQIILEHMGYEVINPCLLGKPSFSYAEFMKEDLKALLECHAIYMLTEWEQSVGARCEHYVAAICGLSIFYEDAPKLNISI